MLDSVLPFSSYYGTRGMRQLLIRARETNSNTNAAAAADAASTVPITAEMRDSVSVHNVYVACVRCTAFTEVTVNNQPNTEAPIDSDTHLQKCMTGSPLSLQCPTANLTGDYVFGAPTTTTTEAPTTSTNASAS